MLSKRWLLPVLLVTAAFAYIRYRRRDVSRILDNLHRYSAPSATLYDAWSAPVLGAFYAQVAKAIAELAPRERVIEIGSGPGRLAIKLAQIAPDVRVTGVDISPEMVERANSLAQEYGIADHVEFRVGDAASLPYPGASLDVAVSTLSLHHWANQAKGLAEIHRVLRPGGTALIYDVADLFRRFERPGPGIAQLVQDSPFGESGAWTQSIAIRLGPIPLIYRAKLQAQTI